MKITAGKFCDRKSPLSSSKCLTSLSLVWQLTQHIWGSTDLTLAISQNIILFLLGLPAARAVAQPHTPLSTSDYILGTLGFLTILIEFVADNQQYSFQTFKHSGILNPNEWPGARIQWTKQDAERGFVTHGLWAWSRHPNFLCEQSFWVCKSQFIIHNLH